MVDVISSNGTVGVQGNSLSYNHNSGVDTQITLDREKHAHEQVLDKQDKEFQLEMQKRQFEHEKEMLSKRIGWIGGLWGDGENSSRNIAAILSALMLLAVAITSIVIYVVNQDKEIISGMWKYVFPFITLALGYIFGKSN